MKQYLGLAFLLAAVSGFAGEGSFAHSISAADFKSAGLNQLSPAQLKHLEELITAYKSPDVIAARRAADEAIAAKKAAEVETQAAKSESVESKKSSQGFFAKAKVFLVPGTKIEYMVIKSAIAGEFEGWEGKTVFALANGQRWQVVNHGDHYFTPPQDNIEVQISPSAFGAYWMDFPSLNVRVRVKLLSDK